MSHTMNRHEDSTPLTLGTQLLDLLSLPHELVQVVLGSITNFEPWTYSSVTDRLGATITDAELLLYIRDEVPLSLIPTHRLSLGLSSQNDWLVLTLSRHSYRLSRNRDGGIASAVTQACRRANARCESSYWTQTETSSDLQIRGRSSFENSEDHSTSTTGYSSIKDVSQGRIMSQTPMIQYHPRVQSEEEAYSEERLDIHQTVAIRKVDDSSFPVTALTVYHPTPILKLTRWDIIESASGVDAIQNLQLTTALFAAILVTLFQCHITLLDNLERLERDTPLPSIERYESKDFATPKLSPCLDRPRSLSGSTVADTPPSEAKLMLSLITTVYDSEAARKRVQWEGREEELVSPKRPRLSQYKQVSSGRVATLMDRFEKFHL